MRRLARWFWHRRKLRWATLLVLGFGAFNIAAVELTSQSRFCNSCHIMNSYYASWKADTHKDTPCVQCHIAPGVTNLVSAKLNGLGQIVDDVLLRTSSKPSASVSDFSCTRSGCHDVSKIKPKAGPQARYFFDHGKHLSLDHLGIGIHCATCHSHVQGGRHFQMNTNVCITCHLAYPAAATATPQSLRAGLDALETFGTAATQPAGGGLQSRLFGMGTAGRPETQVSGQLHIPLLAATASQRDEGGSRYSAVGDAAGNSASRPATAPAVPAPFTKPPSGCRNCHNPPEESLTYRGLKVVHAEYLAYGASCESCHRGATEPAHKIADEQCFHCHDFGVERLTSVQETHRIHSVGRHKVECFSCHGLSRHGPSVQAMQLGQIDCQACHKDQHEIQQVTYEAAGALAHQPAEAIAVTPMFLAHVDCTGCHVQPRSLKTKSLSGATVTAATAKACDRCHKAGLGEQMIPQWQKTTRQLYDAAVRLLPPPDAPAPSEQADRLIRQARQLLELVRLDGSWGVHNPRYTEKLIQEARRNLVEANSSATAPDAK